MKKQLLILIINILFIGLIISCNFKSEEYIDEDSINKKSIDKLKKANLPNKIIQAHAKKINYTPKSPTDNSANSKFEIDVILKIELKDNNTITISNIKNKIETELLEILITYKNEFEKFKNIMFKGGNFINFNINLKHKAKQSLGKYVYVKLEDDKKSIIFSYVQGDNDVYKIELNELHELISITG